MKLRRPMHDQRQHLRWGAGPEPSSAPDERCYVSHFPALVVTRARGP